MRIKPERAEYLIGGAALALVATALLLLSFCGCTWLASQNVDVCVDYKGRHVCVGRKDGAWTFSVDLNKNERDDIIASLGQ